MHEYWGISVKELLKLSSMKNSKVLAGNKGLERNITRLNVMEVPDVINWVEEGEFLLTTAYSMKDNIEQLDTLITDLNNKKVAGLGIKTKRYIEEIPKASLEKAEALGFPLIEIPFDISYSTIITESLTEIINAHTDILSRINNINNSLINVMLEGGSLKEIASAIHESIDKNAVVIQEYILGTTSILCSKDKKSYIKSIMEEEDLKRRNLGEKDSSKRVSSNCLEMLQSVEVNRITIPIYSGDIEYGCIYIWEDKRSLSPAEVKAIKSSTPIIALDIHKKMSILETESKDKTEFFKDLFSGKENRFKKAIENISYHDFNINSSYSIIIIQINDSNIYKKYKSNAHNYINQLKIKLLSIIQRITIDKDYKVISTAWNNSIVMLFSSRPDKDPRIIKEDIRQLCEKILNYGEYDSFRDYLYIGIGRNYLDPESIWQSNKEALRSIDSYKKDSGKKIIYYDDLGIYKILSFENLKPELKYFYQDVLEGLVSYDEEKGMDLTLTLKNYFEYEGNLKKVSENMFIHYNTVVYRLQRIETITNMDLDKYEDRLNLQIALQILDMDRAL